MHANLMFLVSKMPTLEDRIAKVKKLVNDQDEVKKIGKLQLSGWRKRKNEINLVMGWLSKEEAEENERQKVVIEEQIE